MLLCTFRNTLYQWKQNEFITEKEKKHIGLLHVTMSSTLLRKIKSNINTALVKSQ